MSQYICSSGMFVDPRHASMLFAYFPFNLLDNRSYAEMLLSIKLAVDLKIQDCKFITVGVTQENNTIAGGPGYPDVRVGIPYNKFQIESLC